MVHKDITALVSEVGQMPADSRDVRSLRKDLRAHAALIERAAEHMTILPARYGLVFPSVEALRRELLEPQYAAIQALLAKLKGAIELTLRATYIEEPLLRQIASNDPSLASPGSRDSYQSRIETGKRIAAAIEVHREEDARFLVKRLTPVRDIRINKPSGELMVLNASLLVERAKLPTFDRQLATLQAEIGDFIKLDCVGPLPPYSFVDLRVTSQSRR
jgi:hypothetical protein